MLENNGITQYSTNDYDSQDDVADASDKNLHNELQDLENMMNNSITADDTD